ncbi:hypothetical protein KIN20_037998 [Parelaphostrongylus tenuis]|uniref:Uncharacterized protein n=1 Tax=Parelaphostrongylus tenuis TaxID=148309 RepID=A0AAD5RF05_PARTN|nr:hypothetical protein KIN20_037998 [Parelaphostrongylus tenuis]
MTASNAKYTPSRWRIYVMTILSLGFVLVLFGVLMHLVFIPIIVNNKVRKNANLADGSQMMNSWTNPKYEILFKVYAYSVKNPDEIMEGAIPEVKESGPYTFTKNVVNKVLSHNNGVVKFKRYVSYVFNETESCQTCILGNRIWIPNMIYQKFVEAASTPGMRAASATLLSQTPFLEVEVGEFLFEGYKDPFLDKICEIPFMNFVCESILDLPDRIGIFFEKNNTADGVYEIHDGVETPEDLGKILTWNGKKSVDHSWNVVLIRLFAFGLQWSSLNAREIRGTEGMLFPPFLKKSDKIQVFISQLCRSVWLEFQKEVDYHGVPAFRFILPPEVFDPTVPENDGFCNPTDKKFFDSQKETDYCYPKGLLEISKCLRSQPPIMISLPNFNFAPDEVRQSVKGLNSTDAERDIIFVDLEPRLGAVLRAQRSFQINVEMWKGRDLIFPVNMNKSRSAVIPVLIIHEESAVDEDTLSSIKSDLIRTEWLAYFFTTAIAVVGTVIMVIGFIYALIKVGVFRRSKSDSVSPLPAYEPNAL